MKLREKFEIGLYVFGFCLLILFLSLISSPGLPSSSTTVDSMTIKQGDIQHDVTLKPVAGKVTITNLGEFPVVVFEAQSATQAAIAFETFGKEVNFSISFNQVLTLENQHFDLVSGTGKLHQFTLHSVPIQTHFVSVDAQLTPSGFSLTLTKTDGSVVTLVFVANVPPSA